MNDDLVNRPGLTGSKVDPGFLFIFIYGERFTSFTYECVGRM